MEENEQEKIPEKAALDDKALEEASGGLVYPKFMKQWFP